jgi:hypothetical protein
MELAEDLAFRLMGIRVENLTEKTRNYFRTFAREGVESDCQISTEKIAGDFAAKRGSGVLHNIEIVAVKLCLKL